MISKMYRKYSREQQSRWFITILSYLKVENGLILPLFNVQQRMGINKLFFLTLILLVSSGVRLFAQQDTIPRTDTIPKTDSIRVTDSLQAQPIPVNEDSILRITNLNPYITLHVDSTLNYKLDI